MGSLPGDKGTLGVIANVSPCTPALQVLPTIFTVPVLQKRGPTAIQAEIKDLTLCGKNPTQTILAQS